MARGWCAGQQGLRAIQRLSPPLHRRGDELSRRVRIEVLPRPLGEHVLV
jgi:hypothetical protein